MLNRYMVIWTYIANYGEIGVSAESPEAAALIVVNGFSKDFVERGTLYVVQVENFEKFKAKDVFNNKYGK